MKVMCINDNFHLVEDGAENAPRPKFGEILRVIEQETEYNKLYYSFAEYFEFWYVADFFVPISSIDETEMVRDKKEVLV